MAIAQSKFSKSIHQSYTNFTLLLRGGTLKEADAQSPKPGVGLTIQQFDCLVIAFNSVYNFSFDCNLNFLSWKCFPVGSTRQLFENSQTILELFRRPSFEVFIHFFEVIQKSPLHFQSTFPIIWETFWIGLAIAQSKIVKHTHQ